MVTYGVVELQLHSLISSLDEVSCQLHAKVPSLSVPGTEPRSLGQ
jgi:hypothetical protein